MAVYTVAIALMLLFAAILIRRGLNKPQPKKPRKNPMVVLGSGGHTTEMLDLLLDFQFHRVDSLTFVTSSTDITSAAKTADFFDSNGIMIPQAKWISIPRSREVKQSYISAIASTVKASFHSLMLVARRFRHVDILIVNGPGTCLPLAYSYWLLNFVGLTSCKIVFVESWCRVNNLSLTGRLVRPIAHEFFVQWPSLLSSCPSATLIQR